MIKVISTFESAVEILDEVLLDLEVLALHALHEHKSLDVGGLLGSLRRYQHKFYWSVLKDDLFLLHLAAVLVRELPEDGVHAMQSRLVEAQEGVLPARVEFIAQEGVDHLVVVPSKLNNFINHWIVRLKCCETSCSSLKLLKLAKMNSE